MEAAPQRGGLLRLRLRPPELGSLRLEVSLQDGNLSARIETETQAAKTLLLDQLPQLRDRLAEQGFRVARFDVDVVRATLRGHVRGNRTMRTTRGPPRRHAAARPTRAESTRESSPSDHALVHAQPGKLNVVI